MNIIGDLNEWMFIWWAVQTGVLVLVLVRNYLMVRPNRPKMAKWKKSTLRWMIFIATLMGIITVVKNDADGHYINSLLYAVLIFAGGLWISRLFNDDTNTRLSQIDSKLDRLEEKIDKLQK